MNAAAALCDDQPCPVCAGRGWSLGAMDVREDGRVGDGTCEACDGSGRIDAMVIDVPGVLSVHPVVRVVLFGRMQRLCVPEARRQLVSAVDRHDRFGARRAGALPVLVMLAGPRDTPALARRALAQTWVPFVAAGIIPGR